MDGASVDEGMFHSSVVPQGRGIQHRGHGGRGLVAEGVTDVFTLLAGVVS